MRRILFALLAFCCGFVSGLVPAAWSETQSGLSVEPEVMNIGTFFAGGRVTISGQVPEGQDVVVQITGPAAEGRFDVKGRVGPFWLTRGKAELDGAPNMYVLLLPSGQDWLQQVAALGFGLEMLKKKISVSSSELPADELYDMFFKLKKSEGLYVEKDNAVAYGSAEKGFRKFTATYDFPRATAAGKYTIEAVFVSQGAKGLRQSYDFIIDEVGFNRLIDELASQRRLTYGILAVVIALLTGAAMGYLFKGGGSH
jgi:hypothetical protein